MAKADWHYLYLTAEWKRIRARQLAEHPLCAMCKQEGRITPATICDHIEPHKGDVERFHSGPFQSLCKPCHDRHAQRRDRTGRITPVIGLDGWPIEPLKRIAHRLNVSTPTTDKGIPMKTATIISLLIALASPAIAEDLPPEMLKAIKEGVTRQLKDPDSARFSNIRIVSTDGQLATTCGLVNAKNSYGGYTGEVPFRSDVLLTKDKDGKAVYLAPLPNISKASADGVRMFLRVAPECQ